LTRFERTHTMKTVLLFLIASCFALSACNTIQGVGKDVKKVGEVVEDAAKKK
jgi:predicted small secreted protein